MKKLILLLSVLFISSSIILAQEIIENSKRPLNKNAGRVIKLKEVMRIIDTGKKFYFRYLRSIKIAPNGSIFVKDVEQLLQFDSKGRFNRNFFKKGQGPGEIESSFDYHIFKDEIFIYDFTAVKIIHTDLDGNLIKQIKIESGPYNGFCGVTENWYVFMKEIPPPLSEYKNKLYDMKCVIKLVSKNGKIEEDSHTFPRKVFLRLERRGRTSWVKWFSALSDDAKTLYVSHTGEYLIEALDLEKGRILRRFNRKYPRIKYVNQGWEDNYYKRYNVPKIKYEKDVEGLLINKNFIWVKTSTKDEKKGSLIDVFNSEGKYIDNFYLKLDGSLMAAQGDSLFVLEEDEGENIHIVKYKIIE